jgi:hypothetical protein
MHVCISSKVTWQCPCVPWAEGMNLRHDFRNGDQCSVEKLSLRRVIRNHPFDEETQEEKLQDNSHRHAQIVRVCITTMPLKWRDAMSELT